VGFQPIHGLEQCNLANSRHARRLEALSPLARAHSNPPVPTFAVGSTLLTILQSVDSLSFFCCCSQRRVFQLQSTAQIFQRRRESVRRDLKD
jgi:hypothetical protein